MYKSDSLNAYLPVPGLRNFSYKQRLEET